MSLPEIEDPYRFQHLLRETLARLDAAYTLGEPGDTSATARLRRAGVTGRTALDRQAAAAGPEGAVVVGSRAVEA